MHEYLQKPEGKVCRINVFNHMINRFFGKHPLFSGYCYPNYDRATVEMHKDLGRLTKVNGEDIFYICSLRCNDDPGAGTWRTQLEGRAVVYLIPPGKEKLIIERLNCSQDLA
jgi:hypothetical protein